MTNRIIYFISLIVAFVLLVTVYSLIRFVQEEKIVETYRYISPEADLVLEFHPTTIFKEALLTPLFNSNIPPEDRLIFETDRELIPSEPTGISFLTPFYLARRKVGRETLYALYFSLNSTQDFAVFSKKQATSNTPFVFHHFNTTGVIVYSESIPVARLLEIIISDFDQPIKHTIDFTNQDELHTQSPLKIHSLKNGKIHETINLLHHLNSNTIDFSGNIALTFPVIMNKINPVTDGFYVSFALSDELKTSLFPMIKSYINQENWNRITGIELNYAGIKINPKTRQPEPKLNIHIHHTSDSLFNPLDRLPKQWIETNDETDTITVANNMQFACSKSIGLFTLENLDYTWREAVTASTWEVMGKPSALFNIDEPFKSMALAFDPKLRGLNRLVQQINWMSSTANPEENKMVINQKVEFKRGVNPFFELFYFVRKLGE